MTWRNIFTFYIWTTHPPIQIDKSKLYFFKNEIERAANFKNLNRAVSDRIQNNAFFIRSILDFKIVKNVIYFSLQNFAIKIFTIFCSSDAS